MPRLLLFTACERIILSNENTVSLITLLEQLELKVQLPEGLSDPPPDFAIPFIWQALSSWTREVEDRDGVHYQQRVELEMPDGTRPIHLEAPLKFGEGKLNTRSIFKITGFPYYRGEGIAKVHLLLQSVGAESEWREISMWPIVVNRPQPK